MSKVSIRELRNHGGDVVDRVERGEQITITRSGRPVAELRPLGRVPLNRDSLIERSQSLPVLDPARLQADLDDVVDPTL